MCDATCPLCEMIDIMTQANRHECVICGHEWEIANHPGDEPAGERVVKDACGNIVAMIKDLKLKGSSEVLKVGTKSKPICLMGGDHYPLLSQSRQSGFASI